MKIPRWLTQYVGRQAASSSTCRATTSRRISTGCKLVIHCGACMFNRREMLARILRCREAGVPITNYGLVIAYSLGIFERALAPFPAALEAYRQALRDGDGQAAARGRDGRAARRRRRRRPLLRDGSED